MEADDIDVSIGGGDTALAEDDDLEMQQAMFAEWDSLALTQGGLFKQMGRNNTELRRQVKPLKRELSVYQADWEALENRNTILTAKNLQLENTLNFYQDDKTLAVFIIDCDVVDPDEALIRRGREGGRQAAVQTHQRVTQCLEMVPRNGTLHNPPLGSHNQISASILVDFESLANRFSVGGGCSAWDWEQFVSGFNQAIPLVSIIDVGSEAETNDERLIETLFRHSRLHQSRQVLFDGARDSGYLFTLKMLQKQGLYDELIILGRGANIMPDVFRHQNNANALLGPSSQNGYGSDFQHGWSYFNSSATASTSSVSGPRNLVSETCRAGAPDVDVPPNTNAIPIAPAPAPPPLPTLPVDESDMAWLDRHLNRPAPPLEVRIDSTKPIVKQIPPLCYRYYLSPGCPDDSECRYSHDYSLGPGELFEYRKEVKKLPCIKLNRSKPLPCPYSPEDCLMSHYCPSGYFCTEQPKCRFRGKDMHDLLYTLQALNN